VAGHRRAAGAASGGAVGGSGDSEVVQRERLMLDMRDVNALELRYHWLEMDRRLLGFGKILISHRVKQCLVFFAFQECLVFFT
jgi:hypothetical protein